METVAEANQVKIFRSSTAIAVWSAMWGAIIAASLFGAFQPRADRAALALVLPGCLAVWGLGCLLLRRSKYFVSERSFGFQGLFRFYEFTYGDITSVEIHPGGIAYITAAGKTTRVKIDLMTNKEWWEAVASRLRVALGPQWKETGLNR
jgi:hypothetical protein